MDSLTVRPPSALGAFQAFGVEVQYMTVAERSLDVVPLADRALALLQAEAPGELGWSGGLTAHVLRLNNRSPAADLAALADLFRSQAAAMNTVLQPLGAKLMPGGMHPWMDPASEARLSEDEVHAAYDRIFDCRRHGWANVQGLRIDLPFGDAAEFALLHEAVRLVMPILPAIAASSPFADARATGFLDYRMELYRTASAAIPLITGLVVPEPVASPAEYEEQLLKPMYRAIAPRDPKGVLQHEWLNARGAIARFDRSAIELRVADSQECAAADIGLAALTVDAVRLVFAALKRRRAHATLPEDRLARILDACVRDGERAAVDQPDYLAQFGLRRARCTAAELWQHIAERLDGAANAVLWRPFLALVSSRGPLARRLLGACGPAPSPAVYGELCACLQDGRFFDP